MNSYVTDTQALVKFMMGKKVINNRSHQAFIDADSGNGVIKDYDIDLLSQNGIQCT